MSRLLIVVILLATVAGCSRIPACNSYYSDKGFDKSLKELSAEFIAAVEVAKEYGNTELLVEAREISKSRYYISMEEYSCKVQKLYGRF